MQLYTLAESLAGQRKKMQLFHKIIVMTLKYKLKENDFLQMQLYFLKSDEKVQKIIIKSLITWLIIFSIIIFTLYFNNQKFGAILISIGAIISLIFQPFRIKKTYFNRLRKQNKLYENRFNKIITLEILDNYISIIGSDTESKINLSTIKKIIETKHHYFIKLNPEVIIIPKSEIEDETFIKSQLLKLSEKQKVEIENQQNWKW